MRVLHPVQTHHLQHKIIYEKEKKRGDFLGESSAISAWLNEEASANHP